MRQRLENVDPNLCSVNSLIRAPLSYHEKSNRQKVPLTDAELLSMKFPSNQKIYVAPKKTKPYLLHWYYEAIEPTSTPIKRIEVKDKNLVIQTFVEHLEYFDPTLANVDGWVNDLYSPFYKDGNPSVGVNIETGMYKDFGNPADTMNFIAFFARVKQITYQEAKTIIEL